MTQTRFMSALEALVNVVAGYAIAVVLQIAIFPALGLSMTPLQSLKMGGAFTLASVARSLALRRLFDRLTRRPVR